MTEFEWPHVTVEILVERESQKGMVIGKGGQLLEGRRHRRAPPAARGLLPGAARRRSSADWQTRDDVLDRFGY